MRRPQRRLALVPGGGGGDRAAQFDGSNKLSATNGGVFSPPGNVDLYVLFWFVIDAFPVSGNHEIVNVAGGTLGTDGWFVFTDATNHYLNIGTSDGAGYSTIAFSAQALITNKWYMAGCSWDNSGGAAGYEIDLWDTGGLLGSNSSGGRFINNSNPQPLNIGGGVGGQAWMNGRIDKLGIWNRLAGNPVDGTALWNSGAGMVGSDVLAHPTLSSGLVAFYDLDQATGTLTWPDVGGTHPATATGTVVSVPRAGQF